MRPLLVLLALALAGCGASLQEAALRQHAPERRAAIEAALASPDGLRAAFADATRVTYSEAHGTQVEYHAPDGTAWLVYPGNRSMVAGRWTTRPAGSGGTRLCYLYGADTVNPDTGARGGRWDCRTGLVEITTGAFYAGDPLALRGLRVLPRTMPARVRVPLAEAVAATGGDPGRLVRLPYGAPESDL